MAIHNKIMSTLRTLRELDSILDFSRSSNQLLIVFYLFITARETSITEITSSLKLSRKSVLDSIRKLERKGLIEKIYRADDIYLVLSDKGKDYMNKLLKLLSTSKTDKDIRSTESALKVMTRINIGQELITAYRIYKALIAMGFTQKNYMSLKDLAKHMGLSMDRAKSYLDAFSASPSRLFRRISSPTGVYYKLDNEGKRIFYYSSHYMASKKSKLYRFLSRVFKTPWIDEIIAKLSFYFFPVIIMSLIGGFIGHGLLASTILLGGAAIYLVLMFLIYRFRP